MASSVYKMHLSVNHAQDLATLNTTTMHDPLQTCVIEGIGHSLILEGKSTCDKIVLGKTHPGNGIPDKLL